MEKGALLHFVTGHAHGVHRRPERHAFVFEFLQHVGIDELMIERHDVATVGESAHSFYVVGCTDVNVGHNSGDGVVGSLGEHPNFDAERRRGNSHHSRKLSPAHDPDTHTSIMAGMLGIGTDHQSEQLGFHRRRTSQALARH